VDKKSLRILVAAICAVVAVVFSVYQFNRALSSSNYILPLEDQEVLACAVANEKIVSATPGMTGQIEMVAHRAGTTTVECTMEDGTVVTLQVTVEQNGSMYTEVVQ